MNIHFRITVVDGGDGLTYVKDITRDFPRYRLADVIQECAQGTSNPCLLDDMAPNSIRSLHIDSLDYRTWGDVGDIVRVYCSIRALNEGDVARDMERDSEWFTVTAVHRNNHLNAVLTVTGFYLDGRPNTFKVGDGVECSYPFDTMVELRKIE